MSQGARRLRKVALSALHYSGADSMIAPFTRGVGAILTLNQVSPDKPGAFEPNRDLKVTPEFIVQVIQQVRAAGFEIVSLDEAHFRLVEGEYGRPFVLLCLRRRLSRSDRARLSDLPALRPAVRLLYGRPTIRAATASFGGSRWSGSSSRWGPST